MRLPVFYVDAFSMGPFTGNPAAVVPLEAWLKPRLMQAIAQENALSETAFFVPDGDGFRLRWFTPDVEVKLCGHATLATGVVLYEELGMDRAALEFATASGRLEVRRDGSRYSLRFPRWDLEPVGEVPERLVTGLGRQPHELLTVSTHDNWFAVFESETELRDIVPDFRALSDLHPAGVVATAPGLQSDCACRYFAPSYGVDEDPGTGSIHCGLVPFWAERLGSREIHSRQVSARGAEFFCTLEGDATIIAGRARTYLRGEIQV